MYEKMKHYKIIFFAFFLWDLGITQTIANAKRGLQTTNLRYTDIKNNNRKSINDVHSKQDENEAGKEYEMENDFKLNRLKRQHPFLVFGNGKFVESKISPSQNRKGFRRDRRIKYEDRLIQELTNLPFLKQDLRKRERNFDPIEKLFGRI